MVGLASSASCGAGWRSHRLRAVGKAAASAATIDAVSAKAVLARSVKNLAATADRVRGPRRGVVVLIYHRVGAGSGLQVDLPVDLFAAQMEMLAGRGASSRSTTRSPPSTPRARRPGPIPS